MSSLAEISTEHKYLNLNLKAHSPIEPAGFINEPAEVFLGYIPECIHLILWFKEIHAVSFQINKCIVFLQAP